MPQTITIKMDESDFTSDNTTDLVTHGISTCIAFIVYVSFFDDDDELTYGRGLYHWSGFNENQDDPEQETKEVFSNFLAELREAFDVPEPLEIQIERLMFIGGEQAAWEAQELILSGTENEVSSLIKVMKEFDFNHVNFKINPKSISHYHFLTSGDEALTIQVKKEQCIYTKESVNNNYCYDGIPPPASSRN